MTACAQCPRPGVYVKEGKFYCEDHHPEGSEPFGYVLPEQRTDDKNK